MAIGDELQELTTLWGVEASYTDASGFTRRASANSVRRVLRCLGVNLDRAGEAERSIQERRKTTWSRQIDPVVPVWEGQPPSVQVRLPLDLRDEATMELVLEDGTRGRRKVKLAKSPDSIFEGMDIGLWDVEVARQLPQGYHRLTLEVGGERSEALLISAPLTAYHSPTPEARTWGPFLPLYALEDAHTWGAGDYSALRRLADWVGSLSGGFVATLPLLASFVDGPIFDPSPYAPISRLFWSEFYVDVKAIPEVESNTEALAFTESEGTKVEIERLRKSELAQYRQIMGLKRAVLEALSRSFFSDRPPSFESFEAFMRTNPEVDAYARFRAAVEEQGKPWPDWSPELQVSIEEGAYDLESYQYHLFAQWVATEQLASVVQGCGGTAVYLDLPLGVHPDGYDTWRWRELFVRGASVGAPPDAFFTAGQNWGFPPLHPERLRESGYEYLLSVLRHHMRVADYLRVDHVMALHRLWWIPNGMGAMDGVYVRYPAEELYAIFTLESHRNRCAIVGENLGTVPPYVNEAMERHGFLGTYVGQFEVNPFLRPHKPVPIAVAACLNTHDMPTFAAFSQGLDIDLRVELGLMDSQVARDEHEGRGLYRSALVRFLQEEGCLEGEGGHAVLSGFLQYLASSRAHLLQVNLEDLWLEERPQNVPGTSGDRPNWRRKARLSLEEMRDDSRVVDVLRLLSRSRRA